MTRIILNLGGTLYDTLPNHLAATAATCRKLGYTIPTVQEYLAAHSGKDKVTFFRALGFAETDIHTATHAIHTYVLQMPPPRLIPGAQKLLETLCVTYGKDHLAAVTDERWTDVQDWLSKEDLQFLLKRTGTAPFGKAKDLRELARQSPQEQHIYLGDTVDDGMAVIHARSAEAKNLTFLALAHEYAFNDECRVKTFAQKNNFPSATTIWQITDLLS